jgi:Ca2+-transporting ATPase
MPDQTPIWHTLSVEEAIAHLGTASLGLSSGEAANRIHVYGPNELTSLTRESAWRTFAAQFKNALILILLFATVISGFLGHTLEAVVITVIVLFAVLLGFFQEYRASRALDALRQMAAPVARVLRDGQEAVLPARDLVPGDVVLLRTGDRVPADTRLTQSVNLAIDEAALTGESEPAQKTIGPFDDPRLPLGDRLNIAYAGTLAVNGRGQGVVVSTGMSTEFGRIARMVDTVDIARTPLQENLDRLGATLGKAALAVVGLVVVIGLLRGLPVIQMFMFGIALAVAVVPEALPAVVTISLAIGVRRMVKRNALVRRLPIVETLGSTSVICSDKTGTLTRNEMTVRKIFADERLLDVTGAGYEARGEILEAGRAIESPESVRALLAAGVLASDARLVSRDGRPQVEGDPTEGALVVAAMKAGLEPGALNQREPRVDEIPFTSERRRMTTLHKTPVGIVAYSKGAAEEILAGCARQLRSGRDVELTPADRERIRAVEQRMAADGLRVLAVARRSGATVEEAETGMTLLGLVAMMDPPRPEARDAVRTCEAAGIRAVMITGDHPLTAGAVAREVGMLTGGRVVSGRDLEEMSDASLEREVADIVVYARVSPADKLRVVTAWQKRGDVAAMTGDGVNDAPALKKADVGVAMGIAGTDVSKEAAGMTLLDDNFATIVAAVEEGRIVFGNIKKYLMYLLSCNVGEIVLLAGAVIAGLPLPLTARSDAAEAAEPARRHLYPAGRGDASGRGTVVRDCQHHPVHVGAARRTAASGSHGADVRGAGADPVLQRLQLPFRSAAGVPPSVRESLVEPGSRMGARAVDGDRLRAVPAAGVRHVQFFSERLAADRGTGVLDRAGAGGGEMDGPTRLVRRSRLTGLCAFRTPCVQWASRGGPRTSYSVCGLLSLRSSRVRCTYGLPWQNWHCRALA